MHMYIHAYIHTYVHKHVHTYIQTYIHMHIFKFSLIHTQVLHYAPNKIIDKTIKKSIS